MWGISRSVQNEAIYRNSIYTSSSNTLVFMFQLSCSTAVCLGRLAQQSNVATCRERVCVSPRKSRPKISIKKASILWTWWFDEWTLHFWIWHLTAVLYSYAMALEEDRLGTVVGGGNMRGRWRHACLIAIEMQCAVSAARRRKRAVEEQWVGYNNSESASSLAPIVICGACYCWWRVLRTSTVRQNV